MSKLANVTNTESSKIEKFTPKENLIINRYTTVTEDNVDIVANKLFKSQLPCIKALQCNDEKGLVQLIKNECILYNIPLLFLIDGGFRMSPRDSKVNYYGPVAVQLWTHLAAEEKLPLVRNVNIKYILDNLKLTIALQKTYEKILAFKKLSGSPYAKFLENDPEYKDILSMKDILQLNRDERIIIVPKEQIYAIEQYNHNSNFLYCLAGAYNIIGAIGELHFDDGSKFPFKYELDPGSTKISTGAGPSAYSKNPLQFITTKFQRHAMKAYYSTKIALLPQSSDDMEMADSANDVIEAINFNHLVDDRQVQLEKKIIETKQRLEIIND